MKNTICILAVAAALVAGSAVAQDVSGAVKARQGQFRLISLNLGILGGMAKGEIEYDAALAQTAADNLVTVSMINQSVNWPAGSDNVAYDSTRALPKIWDNLEDVVGKWDAYGEAAKAMQAAAGTGLDGVRGAIGAVGGTCKSCHDAYRGPAN